MVGGVAVRSAGKSLAAKTECGTGDDGDMLFFQQTLARRASSPVS